MNKIRSISIVVCLLAILLLVNTAYADLILLGQGTSTHGTYNLIYDTDFDITWYDFTNSNINWQNSMDWASALSVTFGSNTYTDWRLPSALNQDGTGPCSGYNCTGSEIGHLYYTELGNVADNHGCTLGVDCGLVNTGDFQSLEPNYYWTGTEYAPGTGGAWHFLANDGYMYAYGDYDPYYAIAVRPGLAVVPEDTDDDGDGYTENQGDCDDTEPTVHPNAIEIENDGIDQNCDGYEIIDLGTFGGDSSGAGGINDYGQIVGHSTFSPSLYHAYLYNQTMIDLGTLGGSISVANSINNYEQIVGWSEVSNGNRAFLYDNGQMKDLGSLGGNNSSALGINNAGQIVGYSNTSSGDYHAFLYENDNMTDLGTLNGGDTYAYAINDSGQIVGLSGSEAFLYENNTMTGIGTLGGRSWAFDINSSGQIVGDSVTNSGEQHAFLYDNGAMIDLGTLFGGYSVSQGINNRGQVVGYSDGHAFLYDNGIMIDLGIGQANAINENGWIVGFSDAYSGDSHAVLWRPVTVVPEDIDDDGDGYTENQGDCDDTDPAVHPNAIEIENDGIDQNCDGYEIIDLGYLGGNWSQAWSINDSGQIVGRSKNSLGNTHAFLYENGSMSDLGPLSGALSQAFGINNSGQIVGSVNTGNWHAFSYEDGSMSDLGTFGGSISQANGNNNNGQIVGDYYSSSTTGGWRAFLYDSGSMTDLGTLGGSTSAFDINDSGQIVGTSDTYSSRRAFLYSGGIMTEIGTLGAGQSHAYRINNLGQVIGFYTPLGQQRAFLYDAGIVTNLGTLGGSRSDALGINEICQIVGESDDIYGNRHAFLWENGNMIGLGTLGGSQSWAYDINNAGQIVGYAETSTGDVHAVLWNPIFPDPEDIDDDGDGYTENEGDCDDTEPEVNPNATEICNGIDDNCVNGIDEDFNIGDICYSSPNSCGDINAGSFVCTSDGSGTECNAAQPAERSGYGDSCVSNPNNCGDTNTGVNVCAEVGVECNGVTPNDRPLVTAYIDHDSDGYGDINNPVNATCSMPSGAVENSLDCNDNDSSINPGATEIKHDSIDQDCNGYDLTIDIIKANYNIHNLTLKVEATSDLGPTANLELIGINLMTWFENKGKWMITLIDAGEIPAIVTVCGIEGCDSVPVEGCEPKARVIGSSTEYYSSIQEAYNAAVGGDTIQVQEGIHNDNLNTSKTVFLSGGYGCLYTSITGETTVNGNLTISDGILTISEGILIIGNSP